VQGTASAQSRFLRRIVFFLILAASGSRGLAQTPSAAQPPAADTPAGASEAASPWLLVPVFSSSPKLGTSVGGLAAYLHTFDPDSRVSLFGVMYVYTSTHSQIASAFARTSFGADHHRIVAIVPFGNIKNDYDDYLGTGEPLRTDATMGALFARYLYRAKGNWFAGAQGNVANYQVGGATPEDDLILETLGVQGFSSASLGAVLMHDSRDNEDMPRKGWFLNVNNLAYRESLGGSASYDTYRADGRAFWSHGGGHVLAVRQFNWFTSDAPAAAQATVILRAYKLGQYLAPYMSSFEAEERLSFNRRWGATLFAGVAKLYGEGSTPLARTTYPTGGAGLHFVLKPEQRMLVNFEYAQGVEGNWGLYLKLGYSW
jgi:hypothetical protein